VLLWTRRRDSVASTFAHDGGEMMQRSAAGNGALNGERRGRWRAEPDELLAMRTALRSWLAGFGLDTEAEHGLVVAVNEAATNSVEHAYRSPVASSVDGRTFEVKLHAEPDWLCLEITDRGVWQEPAAVAEGRGLGIPLMHQLVSSVTIDKNDRGTRVVLRHNRADGK
jgi:anti-sigma regulatory factor (Ser/Thr protein kinase)